MSFVVTAKWVARPGEQEAVADLIEKLSARSREEAGNLLYSVHRAVDDDCTFFFYEVYADEQGYLAHTSSPHFTELAFQNAIPKLESRERGFYKLWDV